MIELIIITMQRFGCQARNKTLIHKNRHSVRNSLCTSEFSPQQNACAHKRFFSTYRSAEMTSSQFSISHLECAEILCYFFSFVSCTRTTYCSNIKFKRKHHVDSQFLWFKFDFSAIEIESACARQYFMSPSDVRSLTSLQNCHKIHEIHSRKSSTKAA